MPNIVIDQLQANGWTGSAWQINGRVQSDDGYVAFFSAEVASLVPLTVNPALKSAAITAIQTAGSGTVGVLEAKVLLGGVVGL